MTQLVDDEVVVDFRPLEDDQMSRGVAAEPPEAGHTEEPGGDHDAHAAQVDRLWVEVEPIEPGLRARQL